MLFGPRTQELINKYGVSVPRYTSYPTAPEWRDEYNSDIFDNAIKVSNLTGKDYSLYFHLPFCESQCYFCGCNVVISKEHGIEQSYLERIKEEIKIIGSKVSKNRKAIQIAFGGGTPTYLSPSQLKDVMSVIRDSFSLYEPSERHNKKINYEYSIEVDPRVTSEDHLRVLYELGFNRLSMGIQDFNDATQKAINRIQSVELVSGLVEKAREIGFRSINFDLIYGLPLQNLDTFSETIEKVKAIDPDRIALFNYAHLPSMFPFQRKYIKDEELPSQEIKMEIFKKAIEEFTKSGFDFIGIDHFAKKDDTLSIAQSNGTLYRNFQGYTTHFGCDLFGIGLTAISDVAGVYKQNPKKLNDYYDSFGADKFLVCSKNDVERREIIKQIMCNNKAIVDAKKYSKELKLLDSFIEDELLSINYIDANKAEIIVSAQARFFVRNIASKFDSFLMSKQGHKLFSKAL